MILLFVLLIVLIASIMCIIRALKGPSTPDRIVAIDTLSSLMIATIVILGVYYQAEMYLDVALIFAFLAFIGTLAISKYLEGKDVGM